MKSVYEVLNWCKLNNIKISLHPDGSENFDYEATGRLVNMESLELLRRYKSEILTLLRVHGRLLKLGLTNEDVRVESDPELRLDPQELEDIRGSDELFDIWVVHVYHHKQTKLGFIPNKINKVFD